MSSPAKPPIESIGWWWNPGRAGVRFGPPRFREQLKELGEELEVVWNSYDERWQVFMRKPTIHHPIGRGWLFLLKVQNEDGSYRPLDERTLSTLFLSSRKKWGSGVKYWEAVQREEEREQEQRDKDLWQDRLDIGMETFDHSQIKVSMCGKSRGDKFATYHS